MGYWLLSSNEIKLVQRSFTSSTGGPVWRCLCARWARVHLSPWRLESTRKLHGDEVLLLMKPLLHAVEAAACVRGLGVGMYQRD
jgi:hypothetical protein